MKALHEHQAQAIEMLRRSLQTGHRRPMLQAPTGSGKTVIGAAIVDSALRKGKRIIITVPKISLIDQTVERLGEDGIRDVGVMQGYHPLTNGMMPVQVCTLQTLARRSLPPANIVLLDEAHENHEFSQQWMDDPAWSKVPFIGLSATPWTKGLGKFFDDLLVPVTTGQLIRAGHLSPFKVFAPSVPDLKGVKMQGGDYQVADLSKRMRNVKLTADVVETWKARGEDRPTLCYAVDLAHAKMLQQQFAAAGISCGYVDGTMERDERNKVAERFRSRLDQVVVSVGTLTTGIDWDVRCIILARPTKSEILYVQIIGRGLRPAPGKSECLIFDHSNTTANLGFVTDISHNTLDDGNPRNAAEKPKEEKLPKTCPQCHAMRPPHMRACPACGFVPQPQCRVRCEAGDLSELTPEARRADREVKQRWYSAFLHIQADRGYSPKWAVAKYKAKFGVWPRGMVDHPIPPPPEVASWVKSQNIRFIKRKEKEARHAPAHS